MLQASEKCSSVLVTISGRAGWALDVKLPTEQAGTGLRSNLPKVTQQDDNNNHKDSRALLSILSFSSYLFLTTLKQELPSSCPKPRNRHREGRGLDLVSYHQ